MTNKKRKTKRKMKRRTKKIGGMGMFTGMINQAKGKAEELKKQAQSKVADVTTQAQSKVADVKSQAQAKVPEATNKAVDATNKAKVPEVTNKAVEATNKAKVPEVTNKAVDATNKAKVPEVTNKAVEAPDKVTNKAQGNITSLGITTPLTSTIDKAQNNMKTLEGKDNIKALGVTTPLTSTVDVAQNNMKSLGITNPLLSTGQPQNKNAPLPDDKTKSSIMQGNPLDAAKGKMLDSAKGKVDDVKNKVQEKIKEYTEKLKNFKGNPLFGFIIRTFARIYEDTTLLKQIHKSKYIQRNKYLRYINKLDELGKQNYHDACCLVYKYYYKNIAKNFSYLRESDYMSTNCKDKKYIEAQLKLYNSTERQNSDHFNKVFYKQDQFSKLQDTDDVKEMKKNIEDAFIIPKNGIKDPLKYNYSYLILYILHDIHRNIESENIKKAEKLKQTKKIKEDVAKYDITKDAKCTPHKDADVTCDIQDIAISTIAGRST